MAQPTSTGNVLAMLQQWMITVGILISYIVALIIFSAFPGSAATVGWRLVLGLGAVPAVCAGDCVRLEVPARDQGPAGGGDRLPLRAPEGPGARAWS